jgi:hypothetical protein
MFWCSAAAQSVVGLSSYELHAHDDAALKSTYVDPKSFKLRGGARRNGDAIEDGVARDALRVSQ